MEGVAQQNSNETISMGNFTLLRDVINRMMELFFIVQWGSICSAGTTLNTHSYVTQRERESLAAHSMDANECCGLHFSCVVSRL